MPPRDKLRRARLPSTAAKISSIKGLSPDEKALFVRIGNLVDNTVLTQRGLSNAGQVRGRNQSDEIPVPTGVRGDLVIGGIDVSWEPVRFNKFSKYELEYDTSPTFITASQIQLVNSRTLIKERFTGDVYIRVRTVDFTGNCSGFSGTTTVTPVNGAYDSDKDFIEPENVTTVAPKPMLLSKGLAMVPGERIFVGLGGALGPGPITFFDQANLGAPSMRGKIRNEITYSLLDFYLSIEDRRAGIPDYIKDQESFYTFSPSFYIQTNVFTGSFTDFFQTAEVLTTFIRPDIEFLRYLDIPHHETGIVLNATMSVIKH